MTPFLVQMFRSLDDATGWITANERDYPWCIIVRNGPIYKVWLYTEDPRMEAALDRAIEKEMERLADL